MSEPKILFFDVETAPMLAWVWGLFKQNISIGQIHQDWHMLCYAAKWLGKDEIFYDALWEHDAYAKDKTNDEYIVATMWHLLDEADIVVAHNASRFDVAKVNAKFFEYGMKPPAPYKVVDTLKVARANFRFSSNKLDYISQLMNIGEKLKTDFDLWLDVMKGDKAQCKRMLEYNIKDVALLEELYLEMRPWITNHPNLGVYTDDTTTTCPSCNGSDIQYRGFAYTAAGKYQKFVCNSCGHWGRLAANVLPIGKRKNLARNVSK